MLHHHSQLVRTQKHVLELWWGQTSRNTSSLSSFLTLPPSLYAGQPIKCSSVNTASLCVLLLPPPCFGPALKILTCPEKR
jgi:hypothetical protein